MTSLARSLNGDGARAWVLGGLVLLLLGLALAGAPLRDALSFQRDALHAGQWWRLLTAHIVHLDLRHALLNVLGLCLVWALYLRCWPPLAWAAIALASALAVDLGLLWWQPRLQWYVGASGVLHGLLVAGLFAQLGGGAKTERRLAALVLVALAAKLAWEQWRGGSVFLAPGQPVVVAAHLYGAAGGLLAAVVLAAIMRGLFRRPR